ncbi:30S ribosomal protein S17 [Candidatus Woesebacteria bacterium RBG_16_36_11]|uniref:Small ribosomal subunit protein uS17 n=3 Tax=Candidatus Woeseibacteriota TaxID=1752722 RepID=A0A1F7XDE0_9BACT|nr:MAG: 30S ribosomal protein S17 [Candidatus Woesebacteria bacterium RBG_13_36_22]OGM12345.1 MAG: 30S ribosomal protein S17 [Candidatus Woesebacteria bacterium RBG_16_36_11]OGM17236.1 MAG: 30S ribosomal protein S17 [Candidatus Woesebacteria bacterium RBG_19FT_COMBO_37_29]
MKIFTGKVISTKMAKTATVAVESVVVHPMYKKRFKRIKKFHVHDELGTKEGDTVKFVASKPYSKLKKWKVIKIMEKEKPGKAKKGTK